MAERVPLQTNIDSLNRSQSSASLGSNSTITSRRTSINSYYSLGSSRRRKGLLSKLGTGFQTIVRRLTGAHKTLSELEIQILLTLTNFNREEVLTWHAKFLADCPHGYMTRKQFVSMYKSLCPKADSERFARYIFRAFDLDKSNTVDFHEFLIGLSMTSTSSLPQTKLEWIFQVFDIDGNGLLTRSECTEVIDALVRFNYSQQIDGQNDDIEELIRTAKQSMMRIFNNISTSHCNTLTMTEFVEGCLKDELITQLLAPTVDNTNDSTITQNTHDIPTIAE